MFCCVENRFVWTTLLQCILYRFLQQYICLESLHGSQDPLPSRTRTQHNSDSQYSSLSSTVSMNKSVASVDEVFGDGQDLDDLHGDLPVRRATLEGDRKFSRKDSGRGSMRRSERGSERNSVHLSSGLTETDNAHAQVHRRPSSTYGNIRDATGGSSRGNTLERHPHRTASRNTLERLTGKTTAV